MCVRAPVSTHAPLPGVSIEVWRARDPLCYSLFTGYKALLTSALKLVHKVWVKIVISVALFSVSIKKNH